MQLKFKTQAKKWELNRYDLIDTTSPKTTYTTDKNII
jgi:hypothetical protein